MEIKKIMNSIDKKIWIITRRAGYNFGSSLQAYAIQNTISKLGYCNEIIDYDEYKLRWKLRPLFHDLIYILLRLFYPISYFLFSSRYVKLKSRDIQRKKFDIFDQENLRLTRKRYSNSSSITKDIAGCYAVICGSDQIWSPLLFDKTMFLDFVKDKNIRKISYAPSFGVSHLYDRFQIYKELLADFDSLSVRESSGAAIIYKLIGNNAEVVLDPTLLIEECKWDELINQPRIIKESYVLCYFLGNEFIPRNFIIELAKNNSMKIVCVSMYYNRINISDNEIKLENTDPSEFLNLMKYSSFVCTDSFHGSVFSMIFKRQFYCFERFDSSDVRNQNSRIHTLLMNHSISIQLMKCDEKYRIDLPVVNYDKVYEILNENKSKSLNYLANSLC
jgi:hypothetical protein